MKKKKYSTFEISKEEIENRLSGLSNSTVYSFTKRHNPNELINLLGFTQRGYANRLQDNIESIDLIISGDTTSKYILTMVVGRNDTFKGQEKFDIDVMNIAINPSDNSSYLCYQWHHYKDESGDRVSLDVHPHMLPDKEQRKDITYRVVLTSTTTSYNYENYEYQKPDFF